MRNRNHVHALGAVCTAIVLILLVCARAGAQEPFSVACYDAAGKIRINFSTFRIGDTVTAETNADSLAEARRNISALSSTNIGAVLAPTANSLSFTPTISSNLIRYRLGIFTSADGSHYYLPLFLISKLASNYDSSNHTSSVDATNYEGSPLTVRLMPSWKFQVGRDNALFVGAIADFRAVIFRDSTSEITNIGTGFYGAVGVRYGGLGDVRTGDGTTVQGDWSLSLLAYTAVASGNLQRMITADTARNLYGLEGLLQFRVNQGGPSQFNFFLSALLRGNRHDVDRPWVFRFGFGS